MQPLLQWKSNYCYILRVCVYSLRYPACNAHGPYRIVVCGLSVSTFLFHIISQTAQFLKNKIIEHKMCF
jgi:hypothetical protein